MKRFFGVVAIAAIALTIALIGTASGAGPTYSNGFETDTAGWFDSANFDPNYGTITQRGDGYVNDPIPGGYASGISSADGTHHARLDRTACFTDSSGSIGPAVNCYGPFTRWGGYGSTWYGGWTTQVDIYLDATYAQNNPDSTSGNLAALTGDPTNPDVKGTRFDYSSAVNNENGGFIRDFGFNVATGPDPHGNLTCLGFIATAGMNVYRSGADAYDPGHGATCIPESGWYTFKHTFRENMGTHNLEVLMQIIPVGSASPAAEWTIEDTLDHIHGADPSTNVGCNRYGWFADQEIWGLPIDNASIDGGCTPPVTPATLHVTKFYDANANGTKDGTEQDITGWKVKVSNGADPDQIGPTPLTASGLAPGDWIASEFSPSQSNWHASTPTSVTQTLAAGDDKTVSFGNYCTGPGGGLTIGWWGNKAGQALIGSDDLAMLSGLNLVNADGSAFDPTTYAQLKTWLSKASATNMAYMLSAQLAAMELNVLNGKVSGSALVYAPGVTGANAAGFLTVNALMAEANTNLGLPGHNVTKSGSPYRSYQQTLMNALDKANQDQSNSFVQSAPCAFTFPAGPCEAGTGNTGAAYNAIPSDVEHCSPPSEGFEANSDNEFGDRVTLNTTGGTKLVSMTVDFQSYGCESSGHWNTGNCVTPAVAGTFTVPGGITAKIYNGTTLAPIATSNVLNPNIPFRPSAISDVNCPNAPADPNALNSRFKDAVSGQCVYSLSVPLTFTFPAGTTFSSGQDVVWTVQFNTTHAGYNPIGEAPTCFQDVKNDPNKPGCGYDSLNVGAKSYVNAPYAGTDVNSTSVYRSHGNANYGAPFVALSPDSVGWAGYRPLGKIVLGP
jgi:hypothetical protein